MTALKDRLLARIARTGPMTLAEYMTECMLDPRDGYYTTKAPLGAAGDFVTAPEISQMFGEMIGLWIAQAWLDRGAPDVFALVELGPGRGTLMADALRAAHRVPGFSAACRLHLVEASASMRRQQADRLAPYRPVFHDTLAEVPDLPLFLVANEFFDALPIRQFQRDAGDGWRERIVGRRDDRLTLGLGPPMAVPALAHRLDDTEPGQIVETNAPAEAIAAEIGQRVAASDGAALIFDYGDWESLGDTFQAVKKHAPVDPFEAPGDADLTAHVAFGPLARAARPCMASELVPQGVFLERLGITARARSLANGRDAAQADAIAAAHRRLTHPDEMGNLFKVLALVRGGAPQPPGFA